MVLPLNDVSDGANFRPVVARDYEELQGRITPSLQIPHYSSKRILCVTDVDCNGIVIKFAKLCDVCVAYTENWYPYTETGN